MKTVSQIAKENNVNAVILYRRIKARGINPKLEKGIMVFTPEQERNLLLYSKRGRKLRKAN